MMSRVKTTSIEANKSAAAATDQIDSLELFGVETAVPSTAAQREIFSAALSNPAASLGYNHSISIFLNGALDEDALYSALLNLLDRHEALRGRFSPDGNNFLIRERISFELPIIDLEHQSEAEQQKSYAGLIRTELDHLFDLLEGPLFRAFLVKRGLQDHVLVFNCHHAVVDGWSLKIILDEVPKLYSDLVNGRETSTLPEPASFVEYLKFSSAREDEHAESVRAYWKQVYADGAPALDLPLDNRRPLTRSYESKREDYSVDRKIYEQLKAVGARFGVSQFVTLLSSFALYIGRISGQRDFVIGVPVAGQITSGKSSLLGHDARVLPIRCQLEETDTFATFARRIKDRFLAAYENQWITIPELLQALNIRIEQDRAPLIQIMFNFDPGLDKDALHFEGLSAHHFFNHRNAETFEISINSVVEGDELLLEWAYNQSLFDPIETHLRLQQFELLMASIVAQPEGLVDLLPIVPTAQVDAMNVTLNSTAMEFEREMCADHLVERTVLSSPNKIAVEWGDRRLTYKQLWARSEQIAAALRKEDLGPLPMVGVMVERSADMVAVLLGVWRAGAAYVPLDPAYPTERLDYMVEHSGMRVLLTQKDIGWQAKGNVRSLDVDQILADSVGSISFLASRTPRDLAYVIYTSGSTGKPKGVQVPHSALVNFLTTMQTREPGITAEDRLLAVTTLSFDIAELELWLPLITGATTIIADRATVVDGAALVRTLRDAKITFLQATPSTWRVLLSTGWEGDRQLTALCGGEALPLDLAAELLPRVKVLWNVYGPTETTVWSTIDRVAPGELTIGKPIGNTQAYILDAHRNWVPRGSLGELWLGGDGVTHGYLHRDDLTRERFVPNPFTGIGNMYRTGDVARLRRDGRIEYVGRNDFQVKVRGYRIELGEVQLALSRLPEIRQCVVVVRDREPGDPHLVAFYTLNDGEKPTVPELRAGLRATLPDYMVPGWFVELERLPLTDNGKINIKALPDPFTQAVVETEIALDPEIVKVEELLGEHPAINQVALFMPPNASADSRPFAFIVPSNGVNPTAIALRKYLREHCPEKFIPEKVLHVPGLPLKAENTVNRGSLMELLKSKGLNIEAFAQVSEGPKSQAEMVLAAIWRSVLKISQVGVNDRFFDLGGHSLLSIQMIAQVESQTGYRLDPRLVLIHSLGQLAAKLPEVGTGETIQ